MTGRRSKLKRQDLRGLRDFDYEEVDFVQACTLFERLTGMTMIARKRDLVYSRLIRRLRATGMPTFGRYLAHVERDSIEAEHFVNALTTNLTSFFREKHHFPILAEHVRSMKKSHRYRVWCAAASTGEEPYSIAITLAQAHATSSASEIIATDLDTNVLQTAREGIYNAGQVAALPQSMLQEYFLRGKTANSGKVRVIEPLRKSVTFDQLNLLRNDWCVKGTFDAVFLRNVMIYFDRNMQLATLEKIASRLEPEGLLFTGHAESLFYASHLFKTVGPTVYRKR